MPSNDSSYADKLASQQRGQQYTAEQTQLKSTGLYQYDPVVDTVRDLQTRELNYVGNELKSAGRGAKNLAGQFADLLKANNGQTPPSDASPQIDVTGGNDRTPPTASAVVTPLPCPAGPGACGMALTPVITPGSGLPSNAMASSGDDTSSGASSGGAQANTGPYSNLPDSPSVGPGKNFTQAQKAKIYQQNLERNGGVLRSDLDGQELVMPEKSQAGVTPPRNAAQIDHIVPKNPADLDVVRGTNSYGNAQVLSREQNRAKSNK